MTEVILGVDDVEGQSSRRLGDRLNVMWAMLRDHKPYQPTAPNAAAA